MKKSLFLFLIFFSFNAHAWTDEEICNAIFWAEGGYKAKYLYGIRSVKYKNEKEARQICLNTIKNNRIRYEKWGHKKYKTFLEFLASRYAPLNAKNDKMGLNKNWLKNVKYYLNKNKRRR